MSRVSWTSFSDRFCLFPFSYVFYLFNLELYYPFYVIRKFGNLCYRQWVSWAGVVTCTQQVVGNLHHGMLHGWNFFGACFSPLSTYSFYSCNSVTWARHLCRRIFSNWIAAAKIHLEKRRENIILLDKKYKQLGDRPITIFQNKARLLLWPLELFTLKLRISDKNWKKCCLFSKKRSKPLVDSPGPPDTS